MSVQPQTLLQRCPLLRTSKKEFKTCPRLLTNAVEVQIMNGRAAATRRIPPFIIDDLNHSNWLTTLATRPPHAPSGLRMNIDPALAHHVTECYRTSPGYQATKLMTPLWTKTLSLREGELLSSFLRSIKIGLFSSFANSGLLCIHHLHSPVSHYPSH